MTEETIRLGQELKNGITPARLKEISIHIIDQYRRKNLSALSFCALRAGLDSSAGVQKSFSALMHLYHPDKLIKIHSDIEHLILEGKTGELAKLKEIYLFELKADSSEAAKSTDEPGNDFVYSDDDFGYSDDWEPAHGEEENTETDDDRDDNSSAFAEEINFTEAANLHFYGNLDEALTVSDMRSLDGELDLSDSRISDLAGARHCVNLQTLNLSGNSIRSLSPLYACERLETLYLSENSIESLAPLSSLLNLRELDISFNRVEDLSPLLPLKKLEYLNLVGNPVRESRIIDQLLARGVTVIR